MVLIFHHQLPGHYGALDATVKGVFERRLSILHRKFYQVTSAKLENGPIANNSFVDST